MLELNLLLVETISNMFDVNFDHLKHNKGTTTWPDVFTQQISLSGCFFKVVFFCGVFSVDPSPLNLET